MSAGILLLALASCGQKQAGYGGGPLTLPLAGSSMVSAPSGTRQLAPPSSQSPDDPVTPKPPAVGSVLPAQQVEAAALPRGYPRAVWVEADDRTLGMYGQEGGCGRVHAQLGEQSPSTVRIAFVEVVTSNGVCTMDMRFPLLRVTLDAPLGDRVVVLTVAPK